jgi:radical SAM protein with 4Fe4S-binding SPASM domain
MLRWLSRIAAKASYAVKTTEAHHFRRVRLRAMRAEGMSVEKLAAASAGLGSGVRDANGIAFVSHLGEVHPSGFLPLRAGNVRTGSIVEIYRNSPVFRSLRETDRLKGKCGLCDFRRLCGGSRARAFAATGDPMESDPLCVYQPGGAGTSRSS